MLPIKWIINTRLYKAPLITTSCHRGAKWWSFKDDEPERRPLHRGEGEEDVSSSTKESPALSDQRSRPYRPGQDGHLVAQTLNPLRNQNILTTKKSYTPPVDLESRVQRSIEVYCPDSPSWMDVSLENRRLKFKILTDLMSDLDTDVPSLSLDSIKTGQDVYNFFKQEKRVTSTLDDMANSFDLPANVSVRNEYNRFDTSEDSFFKGKTAYPGRDTHVTSLKNSRKYQTIRTKVQKPGYLDHYYDY